MDQSHGESKTLCCCVVSCCYDCTCKVDTNCHGPTCIPSYGIMATQSSTNGRGTLACTCAVTDDDAADGRERFICFTCILAAYEYQRSGTIVTMVTAKIHHHHMCCAAGRFRVCVRMYHWITNGCRFTPSIVTRLLHPHLWMKGYVRCGMYTCM